MEKENRMTGSHEQHVASHEAMDLQTSPTAGIDRRAALAMLGSVGAVVLGAPTLAGAAQPAGGAGGAGGGHATFGPFDAAALGWDEQKGEFVLPELPYAHDALEPFIDAQTMQIHHSKHHASYVAGLNKALAQLGQIRSGQGDAGLIKHWSRELAFHGGGHINHAIFWRVMAPAGKGGGGEPGGALARAIVRDFGSFAQFKSHFTAAANAVEGSGWAWLVLDRLSGRLMVQQMEKQQNMLLTGSVPLLGIDVWEHAYYLKYQNRRGDYVNNWFSVVNWPQVLALYTAAMH
jgi:Fe-Mn family superoxide dismutase